MVVSVPILGSPWWVGRAASLKSPPGLSWAWEGGAGVPRTSPTFLLEPLCVVNSARPGNRSLEVAQLRPRPAGLSCQPLFLAPLCYGKLNLRVLVAVPFPVPPPPPGFHPGMAAQPLSEVAKIDSVFSLVPWA